MAKREQMGTAVEVGVIERIAGAVRYVFTGKEPIWFGPLNPLPPYVQGAEAQSVVGRQLDYPVGYNQRTQPRTGEAVTFADMRGLADGYDIMRLVIETRKDQIAKLKWHIRPKDEKAKPDLARIQALTEFFAVPDGEHIWNDWLRMLLEDLFVLDAPTLYVRRTRGGGLYALEPVDGSTIKRVVNEFGRTPEPPLPAYQQILKGVPAINYTSDELIYRPRNLRTHKFYGYSPVEQVIMTVNIALRRQLYQLAYYTEGNVPEALASVPKEWNPDQIAQFQMYWDSLLEGDAGARRHLRFIPDGITYKETKAPPLKDEYDEWLARVICFAFSMSPTPFIRQMNRATANQQQDASKEEGLAPICQWIKSLADFVLVKHFRAPDLEFGWQEEEAQDPLVQAQVNQIYVETQVLTPDEVRQDLGRDPMTPEQRDKAFPQPPTPIVGGDPSKDEPNAPKGEGKLGEPKPEPNKEALLKKKSALTPIDRDRPAIAKARAKLEGAVAKFLKAKGKEIAAQVIAAVTKIAKTDQSEIDRILESLDFETWVSIGADVEPELKRLALTGVEDALKQIGVTDRDVFELANERAIKWSEQRSAEMVGMSRNAAGELVENPNVAWRIDEATRDMLRGTVALAMEEGWSNDKLAAEIEADHAFSPERAEMIARTETAYADVAGNMEAYRASGVVEKKKWIVGADCCDLCDELNGEIVDLDEDFPNDGGDGPPLHPNCRCDCLPILTENED